VCAFDVVVGFVSVLFVCISGLLCVRACYVCVFLCALVFFWCVVGVCVCVLCMCLDCVFGVSACVSMYVRYFCVCLVWVVSCGCVCVGVCSVGFEYFATCVSCTCVCL